MFNKFVEDSYLIVQNCEIDQKERLEDQKDEISIFLKNLKLIEKMSTTSDLNIHGTLLKVTNPKALAVLEAEQNQYIRNSQFRLSIPRVINLTGFLVKYLEFFKMTSEKSLEQSSITTGIDKSLHNIIKVL